MNKNIRILLNCLSFIIIFIFYLYTLGTEGKKNNIIVYLTNASIVIFSLIKILSHENKSYSAKKTFYLFTFFFLGIAPILQYKNVDETVGGYTIKEETYIFTNIVLFIILLLFNYSYNLFYKKEFKKQYNYLSIKKINKKKIKQWTNFILAISICSCLFTIYYKSNNYLLLFFRNLENLNIENEESGNFLSPIYNCFIRPLTVVCCINYMCIGEKKKIKFILLLLMLISCFPTSLSRLRTAAYYIPLLLLFFPNLKKRNRYVYIFIFGILFIFPFLNQFRYWGTEEISFKPNFEMFRTMHFDSYQSLAFVLQNGIITYGQQLLLVFLFWVPRSIWPDKPYMSGRMVAHEYDLWFDQISMNYFAEGYLNFGFGGIFIFTIILAYITSMFDKIYWKYNNGNIKTFYAPFFLFFVSIYFFFMRGDLMFGFQYTIMLLFANYFIFRMSKKILS